MQKQTLFSKNLTFGIFLFIAVIYIIFDFPRVSAFTTNTVDTYFFQSLCEPQITYKIGMIDSRFGIDKATLRMDLEEATSVWNKANSGEQIFIYDDTDKSAITVNLVYDKRTDLSNQINSMENDVKQRDQSLQAKINTYEQNAADFKRRVADFEKRLEVLNSQVDNWNRRGGAPQEDYEKLIQEQNNLRTEQESLQNEAERLNETARSLNLSTKDFNANVRSLNSTINTFNNALEKRPEEGVFNPNKNLIDIYFNNNREELIHTLTHEFGHALGLPHNENEDAIMYPYTSQSLTLADEDLRSLQSVCTTKFLRVPFLPKKILLFVRQRAADLK